MRQGPGFGPRSSASARSSSGGGVRHAGSNPSEGSERSYDWSYVRSLSMLPSRPGSGPSPWRESSILNPGKAMWGPRNAYDPLADSEYYPDAVRLLTDDMDYGQLTPGPADFVVIATQHKGDHQSLQRALRSGASRIALIASRKRARLVMDYLRSEGFDATDLQRVSAPAGFDLGARSPEEIALSVVCELVMQRRGGSGLLLRDKISQPEGADPSA